MWHQLPQSGQRSACAAAPTYPWPSGRQVGASWQAAPQACPREGRALRCCQQGLHQEAGCCHWHRPPLLGPQAPARRALLWPVPEMSAVTHQAAQQLRWLALQPLAVRAGRTPQASQRLLLSGRGAGRGQGWCCAAQRAERARAAPPGSARCASGWARARLPRGSAARAGGPCGEPVARGQRRACAAVRHRVRVCAAVRGWRLGVSGWQPDGLGVAGLGAPAPVPPPLPAQATCRFARVPVGHVGASIAASVLLSNSCTKSTKPKLRKYHRSATAVQQRPPGPATPPVLEHIQHGPQPSMRSAHACCSQLPGGVHGHGAPPGSRVQQHALAQGGPRQCRQRRGHNAALLALFCTRESEGCWEEGRVMDHNECQAWIAGRTYRSIVCGRGIQRCVAPTWQQQLGKALEGGVQLQRRHARRE